jgi:predicted RNA binding protein YcfA (HicA-like mRNA interferase family)
MLLPAVTSAQVIRALHKAGFVDGEMRGKHMILWNPTTGARTVVPTKPSKRAMLRAILRDAGLSIRQFLKFSGS